MNSLLLILLTIKNEYNMLTNIVDELFRMTIIFDVELIKHAISQTLITIKNYLVLNNINITTIENIHSCAHCVENYENENDKKNS